MSDKTANVNENNSASPKGKEELSQADLIHQKIKELKNKNKAKEQEASVPQNEPSVLETEKPEFEDNKLEKPEETTGNQDAEVLAEEKATPEEEVAAEERAVSEEQTLMEESAPSPVAEERQDAEPEQAEESAEEEEEEPVEDYSGKTKEEFIELMNAYLSKDYKASFNKVFRNIKAAFNLLVEKRKLEMKEAFLNNGGKEEDFEYVKDETELKFHALYQNFLNKKETFEVRLEEEKKKNLELKYNLIEEIKELVNKPESFTKIFNRFKNLQKKWNDIGLVPKNEVKALFDEYNKNVQKFYEYVEVNKELRELDFKKNYEIKIALCEKAEELLLETKLSKAKKELQTLHKKWKETGSVANEVREELWSRFQAATIKINDSYSEYISEIREQQNKNLESKQFLVQKAEELASKEYNTHVEWKSASDNIIEIQKLWKKIGYVPKEYNNKIYAQFKAACDSFFERIREFYAESEKDREDNYQKKLDLCTRAESLQDSEEWSKTSEIYKQIQAEWKKIGPVSGKKSDEIWKRFRKACNTFFDRKKDFYKKRKSSEKENLVKKKEIIEKIENFEHSDNQNEVLEKLKEFQNEFIAIGFVPFDQKDEIYDRFHKAINEQYEKLNISKEKLEQIKLEEDIEALKQSPDAEFLIQKEMGRIQNQIDKLNDDIKVWENNIGFFSSSAKSESLLKNVKDKIVKAKAKVEMLTKKMNQLHKSLD